MDDGTDTGIDPGTEAAWQELLAAVPPATTELVRAADALVRASDPAWCGWCGRTSARPATSSAGGRGPSTTPTSTSTTGTWTWASTAALAAAGLDGGLLEGTGASFRKCAVRTVDDLADPRLPVLLRAAREERLRALGG